MNYLSVVVHLANVIALSAMSGMTFACDYRNHASCCILELNHSRDISATCFDLYRHGEKKKVKLTIPKGKNGDTHRL